MDIVSMLRQIVSFITTYLATVTIILLLTDTIVIVNNGNILTDRRDKKIFAKEIQ